MIKYSEIKGLFSPLSIPCEEYKMELFDQIQLPFIVYLIESNNTLSADGVAYLKLSNVQLELVTDELNSCYIKEVEEIFLTNDIYYNKEFEFDEDNRVFITLYSFACLNE